MRQRNFVAKHAQRSGAGRHKRKDKDMSYIGQEDWVHIDAHNDEVNALEDKVAELEQVIKDMQFDEAYLCADLIELRWRYSDYKDMYEELEELIRWCGPDTTRKAIEMLGEKYPSKKGFARWDLTWLLP